MKKAIIFGMDGLMVDSKPTWEAAERRLVEDYGKQYSTELTKKYHGLRVQGMIKVMIEEYQLPTTQGEGKRKLKAYVKNNFDKANVKLLPGCARLVKSLSSSKRYGTAIASSSPIELIEAAAEMFNFTDDFKVLVSAEEVPNGKPAPDVFLRAAELLGTKPALCIVLEDAPNGIKAAKAAGMKAIAVSDNPAYTKKSFSEADKFVKSLEEINIGLIEQLLSCKA